MVLTAKQHNLLCSLPSNITYGADCQAT